MSDEIKNNFISNPSYKNKVSKKLNILISITQVIGYIFAAIVLAIGIYNHEFFNGLIFAVLISFITFACTVIYEAIAEGLELLTDIKSKK